MPIYKRYIIPLRDAQNNSSGGGKCLIECLQDGKHRATLSLRGVKPMSTLTLNIFDGSKRWYCYPKTLRADKNGVIALRQFIDCGEISADDIRYICLLDNGEQPIYTSSNNNFDWKAAITAQKLKVTEEEIPQAEIPEQEVTEAEHIDPVQTKTTDVKENGLSENADKADGDTHQTITPDSFKQQVKDMVIQLDQQLKMPPFQPFGNDHISWRKITLKDLTSDRVLWKYAGNPFVAGGCKAYHYLLRGENEKFRFLAVPCDEKDRLKGKSQGFHSFASEKDENGICHCILKCEK